MIRLIARLWPRGKWRMRAYKLGYAEGYDAAFEHLDRLTEEAYRSGKIEGIYQGKHEGIAKRSHYTRLMLPSEEDD